MDLGRNPYLARILDVTIPPPHARYGVERNYKKALDYFKAAADRGNAEAQFNLGAMHIGGMGIKKAYDKALHYFTLSAHQGHTLALYNLAQMHLNGLGTPRSTNQSEP